MKNSWLAIFQKFREETPSFGPLWNINILQLSQQPISGFSSMERILVEILVERYWIILTPSKSNRLMQFVLCVSEPYDTAYACEGKILRIECKNGELIDLLRANYGRFSITVCNDHGNTEWSVNCMAPKSRRVLQAKWVWPLNKVTKSCLVTVIIEHEGSGVIESMRAGIEPYMYMRSWRILVLCLDAKQICLIGASSAEI